MKKLTTIVCVVSMSAVAQAGYFSTGGVIVADGLVSGAGGDTTFTNYLGGDTEIVVTGDARSGSNILSIGSAIARRTDTNGLETASHAAATYAPISVTIPAASNAAVAGVSAGLAMTGPLSLSNPNLNGAMNRPLVSSRRRGNPTLKGVCIGTMPQPVLGCLATTTTPRFRHGANTST